MRFQKLSFLRADPDGSVVSNEVGPSQHRLFWFLSIGIVALLLIPIWTTHDLPLADYPQSLARGYIAAHYAEVPLFQQRYEPPLNVGTNRAFEAVAFVVGGVMSLELLGKIFITIIILLFAISCYLVPRLFHGHPMWTTLPMLFFIYSTHLIYGSINFLFGLVLFFLVFVLWRSTVGRYRVRAAILLLLASPILFLIHMAAYAFLWPSIGISLLFALRAGRISRWQIAAQFAPLAVSLALLRLFFTHGGVAAPLAFNTVYTKAIETLTLISTYRRSFDVFFVVALAAILLYAFVSNARWRFAGEALAIGVAFYLLLLLFPGTLFAASGADVRFLIPSAVFGVSSLHFALPLRSFRIAFASVLLLFIVRLASIAMDWHRMSDWLAPQLALIERVPEGSRIYPMYYDDSVQSQLEHKLFPTFGVYAAVKHRADHPGLLTIRLGEQTGGHYLGALADPPLPESLRAILRSYDYLWCYRLTAADRASVERQADPVASANEAVLYRVKHGGIE